MVRFAITMQESGIHTIQRMMSFTPLSLSDHGGGSNNISTIAGGSGGGGNGTGLSAGAGGNGVANTGSGAGGTGDGSVSPASGGSGLVIVRYAY